MKKLKNILSIIKNMSVGINFALIAFVGYVSKMLYFSPSLADAPIFLAICGIFAYDKYLKSKRPDPVRINDEVQAQINEIRKNIRDTQLKENIKNRRYF